jgi:hypothetical protein
VTSILLQFSYLQVLDYLTTIAFLLIGVQEGNPLVRLVIEHAPSPLWGLAVVKGFALLLGLYCLKAGKLRLLSRVNIMFALLVAWNMIALILGAAKMA